MAFIVVPCPSADLDCHVAGGTAQRHAFLLLCGRHLPGLLLLWLDCPRALPREGKGYRGCGCLLNDHQGTLAFHLYK